MATVPMTIKGDAGPALAGLRSAAERAEEAQRLMNEVRRRKVKTGMTRALDIADTGSISANIFTETWEQWGATCAFAVETGGILSCTVHNSCGITVTGPSVHWTFWPPWDDDEGGSRDEAPLPDEYVELAWFMAEACR